MKNKNTIYTIVCVLAFGAAAYLIFGFIAGDGRSDEGLNRPTWWACKNDGCGNMFEMTTGEANRAFQLNGGFVACPNCESFLTKRAYPCYNCNELVESDEHGDPSPVCNHCGTDLTRAFEHTHADGTTHTHGEAEEEHEHEDGESP